MIKLKKSFVKLITAIVVTSSLVFTSLPCYKVNAEDITTEQLNSNETLDYGLAKNIKDGTILHAWCWSFNTIKDNMKDIAEAGFSTVQTSPANTCVVGENGGMDLRGNGKWYYHYQPTDWKIGNYQLGTRDEFKAMCDEAEKYGVKIIVDVVPNHTTTDLGAVSQDLKNAVGGQDNLYHANGFHEIQNNEWGNRYICTTGAALGLPDVNTENPAFQKYFLNYLNDCIDCGADGFRYDTAKHIGVPSDPLDAKSKVNNFWKVVTGKEAVDGLTIKDSNRIFNYGEILQGDNVNEVEYSNYISQTASRYGDNIRAAISNKDFSTYNLLDWKDGASADKLVTWVESHDTYCDDNEQKASSNLNDWQIKMAWAVIAARKGGTPLFYSRPDGSSTSNRWGNNKIGKKGNDAFKDSEVVEVNKFRNAMTGESEYLRNINGNKQILSIERGKIGQVIVNLGETTTINSDTNLNDGVYTDRVSKHDFTVSGGKISGYIEGGKVAVLYGKPVPTIPSGPVDKAGIYFEKPATWGNDIKAYVYDEKSGTGIQEIAKWPGIEMTKLVSGKYFYELPSTWKYTNTQVIFTDGSNQEPASIGLEYTLGKAMEYMNGEWIELEIKGSEDPKVEDGCIYFNKPVSWGNNIKVYIYDEKSGSGVQEIAKWPGTEMIELSNGEYFYKFPSTWKCTNTQVIFTDGSNQVPASIGLEYTLGTTMEYKDGSWNQVQVTENKEAA